MTLRAAVATVAALNLAYFGVEFAVAITIGSVSLFADSIDFLEDASINILIAVALGWTPGNRARLGMAMAVILLIPSGAALVTAWNKLQHPVPPASFALSATGLGALAVNLICALLLARFRSHQGSLTRAAFLSARNDVFANAGIILAGSLTAYTLSAYPDLLVGIGIALVNLDAAREVWQEAKAEGKD